MGNRAVIKFDGLNSGVYLHWNGGRDSVEPFLEYCRLRNFRCDEYGVARFCQVVGNWFGGTLSIGVYTDIEDEDEKFYDNGIYVVKDWKIIRRIPEDIEEQKGHDFNDILLDVDDNQPEKDRLGADYILAPWVKTKDIQPGDYVYVRRMEDYHPSKIEVLGTARDPFTHKVLPYVAFWGEDDQLVLNTNNFLHDEEYKVAK